MTVTTQVNDLAVPLENLQAMLCSTALIRALARQIVVSQVEANIEMMSDCPEEYPTFKEAEVCIQSAKENVEEYIEDLLAEFKERLYDQVAKVSIEVQAIKFTEEGFIDADVLVDGPLRG